MKSLTKKALVFIFAIAVVFFGIYLVTNYKDAGDKTASAAADTSWYNGSATVFNIDTADELAGLAVLVNNGNNFSGKTVNLKADINLTESGYNDWTPIGYANWVYGNSGNYATRPFSGTFNGGGYTIKNLTITTSKSGNCYGLFGCIYNSTIKDLVFENVDIAFPSNSSASYNAGTAVAYAGGNQVLLENIKVLGGRVGVSTANTYSTSNVGGIIGLAQSSTIEVSKCYNKANVNAASFSAGGIMGYASYSTVNINNSFNTGNIKTSITDSRTYIGGILGLSEYSPATITMMNCYNTGNVTSVANGVGVGGIFGANWGSAISANIINCFNVGEITNNGVKGGLTGYNASPLYTTNSWHSNQGTNAVGSGSGNTNSYKSISDMQSPEFAALLGPDYIYNPEGFPILKVFSDESTTTATVILNYNYADSPPNRPVERLLDHSISFYDIEENPLRTAYNFSKWTETQDGSGGVWYVYEGDKFVQRTGDDGNSTITIAEVTIDDLDGKTLYAQWTPIEYTLEIEDEAGLLIIAHNINIDSNIPINAGEFSTGWMRWEIYNAGSWAVRPEGAAFNIADVFDSLINYADLNGLIRIRPIFADDDTVIYRLTIKSLYESYGSVSVNGNAEPAIYNAATRFEERTEINLKAEAYGHYEFVEYVIDGIPIDTAGSSEYTFILEEDTTVFAKFKRKQYDISILSQYISGELISSPILSLVGGKSTTKFRIGDRIQVTYKTNVDGFKFSSLKLPGFEDTTGSGEYYLNITKEILDNYLESNELKLVVEYSRQYLFSLDFENQVMYNYCEIEIYNEILDSVGEPTWNPIYGSKYIDSGTKMIIQFTLNEGYEVSFTGLTQTQIDELLLNGELELPNISSAFDININITPIEYNVNLKAKWEDETIDEIDFSTGKDFTIEHNGETDKVIRSDISKYRFTGWYIYHWENTEFTKISDIYIDINGNLKPLTYQYLKESGFLDSSFGVEIVAAFVPVYNLTVNASGSWNYEVKINNEVVDNFKSGQYDHNTVAVITVKQSDYMSFEIIGAQENAEDILNNGYYVLTLNLTKTYVIDLKFDLIKKTLNIVENLSGAKGNYDLKGGERDGNELEVKYDTTLTFTFEAAPGQSLKEWTIKGSTVMTADELVAKNWATRNGNVLKLYLNNEETLDWFTGSGELTITIGTIFNPLFTALIAVGSVLIVALAIFIILYAVAANNKKKKIKAAVEAGIIGAARFKINFTEDLTKDSSEDLNKDTEDFKMNSDENSNKDLGINPYEDLKSGEDLDTDPDEDLNKD